MSELEILIVGLLAINAVVGIYSIFSEKQRDKMKLKRLEEQNSNLHQMLSSIIKEL